MQDITPLIPKNKKQIETYGAGGFQISGEKFPTSIFLTTDNVTELNIPAIENFTEEVFSKIESEIASTEILLVGFGTKSEFLNSSVEKIIRAKKISIEYMNTGAACRTYNVLLSEGRNVSAILIAV